MSEPSVLLVDDDVDFVEVVGAELENEGFCVTRAHSGQEAREKAPEECPDAIVLDVMMETDTEGFEVARWLREREDLKDIPLIMLTGVNQEFPFKFGPDDMWLPVDKFLEKPVKPARLAGELRTLLQDDEGQ
jgi:CheY-like chemotaxis protein